MYSLCFAKILEVDFRNEPFVLMITVCTSLPKVGPFPSTADALDLVSSSRHSSGSRKLPVLVYNYANFPPVDEDAKHNPDREEATKKKLMGLLNDTRNDYSKHPKNRAQLIMIFRQQRKLALSGGVVTYNSTASSAFSSHATATHAASSTVPSTATPAAPPAAPSTPKPSASFAVLNTAAPATLSAATSTTASATSAVPANLGYEQTSYLEAWKDVYNMWDSQVGAPHSVQQEATQLVGVDGHELDMLPKVSASAQRLCSRCKQPGHNKNNKVCPLFG